MFRLLPETAPAIHSSSPSVHPLELPATQQTDSRSIPFRHSGWQPQRARTLDAFRQLHIPYHRTFAFQTCGNGWWILQNKTDPTKLRVVNDTCHDRFCAPCSQARTHRIRCNLSALLPDHPLRFITLTLRSSPTPLSDQVQRLYTALKRLRSRHFWRTKVRGGLAVLELTVSKRTGLWHPHLHVLVDSGWIEQSDLRSAWRDLTGDSDIVDIGLVRSTQHALRYVTKYITKPFTSTSAMTHAHLAEAIDALAGRRLIIQFGKWSRWRLTTPDHDPDWSLLCHSNAVYFTRVLSDAQRDALIAQLDALPPDQSLHELDLPPP